MYNEQEKGYKKTKIWKGRGKARNGEASKLVIGKEEDIAINLWEITEEHTNHAQIQKKIISGTSSLNIIYNFHKLIFN